ncbi:hypothetical protein BU14_0125s0030 [Porphyra umbilicalis]|uniref:Uncharacterized protein n=1 Tax=Porphyra umbilicalis TaxID=2786 RepID=A0A1X6PAZ8_PORUM|nr:hypothetical protein BU14_0125s0030 [Porphyra umbilicalis]|eukprot:OSX78042.1 hypothetical protein BU14_0125s0030 [Porphyra umbilicalis]
MPPALPPQPHGRWPHGAARHAARGRKETGNAGGSGGGRGRLEARRPHRARWTNRGGRGGNPREARGGRADGDGHADAHGGARRGGEGHPQGPRRRTDGAPRHRPSHHARARPLRRLLWETCSTWALAAMMAAGAAYTAAAPNNVGGRRTDAQRVSRCSACARPARPSPPSRTSTALLYTRSPLPTRGR